MTIATTHRSETLAVLSYEWMKAENTGDTIVADAIKAAVEAIRNAAAPVASFTTEAQPADVNQCIKCNRTQRPGDVFDCTRCGDGPFCDRCVFVGPGVHACKSR